MNANLGIAFLVRANLDIKYNTSAVLVSSDKDFTEFKLNYASVRMPNGFRSDGVVRFTGKDIESKQFSMFTIKSLTKAVAEHLELEAK